MKNLVLEKVFNDLFNSSGSDKEHSYDLYSFLFICLFFNGSVLSSVVL